jgi:hypothetical protein
MVTGTDKMAPRGPKIADQKTTDNTVVSGDRSRFPPMYLGLTMYPAMPLMIKMPRNTMIAAIPPDSNRARKTGGIKANKKPIVGMKLIRKARKPHRTGKSTPMTIKKTVSRTPVARPRIVVSNM